MGTISGSPLRDTFCAFFAEVFTTSHHEHHGQPFSIVSPPNLSDTEVIAEIDQGIMPMYRIRFSDGEEIDAWPEEVESGWEPA